MRVLDIPGYVEAVIKERQIRDTALLGLGENLNGFEVVQMTLRHYLTLKIADSPMLPPFSVPPESELAQFLWLLNPGWSPDVQARKQFLRLCKPFMPVPEPRFKSKGGMERWQKRCDTRLAFFIETVKACNQFVTETFQDAPKGNGGVTTEYYSDGVAIIGALGREHKIQPESAMEMNLKVIFQLLKEIHDYRAAMNGMMAPLTNPSDDVTIGWLKAQNAALRRN